MFRIFEKNRNKYLEPVNGLYNVRELGHYRFEYHDIDGLIDSNTVILLEDELINSKIEVTNGILKLRENLEPKEERIFEDYFGLASLRVNNKIIAIFNITINKLKKNEIEDIFIYLWKKENKVFNNFLSRSSIQAQIHNNENKFGLTSKFLIFVDKYYNTLYRNLYNFKKKTQTVLRTEKLIVPYKVSATTVSSIEWILTNLDEVMFDPSFAYHLDSIKIENTYGYLERIQTDLKKVSFDVYENQIILGSFEKVLLILASLKKELSSRVNLEQKHYSFGDQVDFRDLRKVAFVVLNTRIKAARKKIIRLHRKYQDIFLDTKPKLSKPRLTSTFSHRLHYQITFKLIKELWGHNKLSLGNELNLLSIKKLHKLYEIYNLHRLIEELEEILDLDFFDKKIKSYNSDGIVNQVEYSRKDVVLKLFYELNYHTYPSKDIELVRIDGSNNHYNPDYILEISNSGEKKYFIFDAKYTTTKTLEGQHLNRTIKKYIVNTGLKNDPYRKIDFLGILYPGYKTDSKIKKGFYPEIWIISSKPKAEVELRNRLEEILLENIPSLYFKNK